VTGEEFASHRDQVEPGCCNSQMSTGVGLLEVQSGYGQYEYTVEIEEGDGTKTTRVTRQSLPVEVRQRLEDLGGAVVTRVIQKASPGKAGKLSAKRR
jgi:hypothetical protein